MEKNAFAELFQSMLDERNMNYRAAARKTPFAHTTLMNWAQGDNLPSRREFVVDMADGIGLPRVPLLSAAQFMITDADREHDRDHFPDMATEASGTRSEEELILARFARLGPAEWDLTPLVGPIHAATFEGGDRTPEYPEGIVRLIVQGECMWPVIRPGDSIRLRVTQSAESGEIVAVSVGEELLLRQYLREDGGVVLRARNPAFPDVSLPAGTDGYRIEGVVLDIAKTWQDLERLVAGEGKE